MDNLVRGCGWRNGKGCAIGCTLEQYDHKAYETELGIPEWLALIEDTLYEGMSSEKSKTWPEKFLKAITPGVDLNKAESLFLIEVLKSTLKNFDHNKFPEVKKSIDRVITLYKEGGTFVEFRNAALAAVDAADASDASDYAASAAAHTAAHAAYATAAYTTQAIQAAAQAIQAAARATYAVAYATSAATNAATSNIADTTHAASIKTYDKLADKLLMILKDIDPPKDGKLKELED